ncbi:MAG TPA: efflux RND transporter periplasmic adaptor subunit [Bacteroidota bacterium]|nr:efflux RND transporter periplasmic adaptor subunit [Bacteroidota bacterium]
MKNRIVLLVVLAIVVIGAGGFFIFSNGSAGDVNYRFEKVSRGDVQVVVTATGTLNADTTVQVGTQVSGTIQKLYVDFNSKVKKNQVVALIDPTFLQSSVEDAEANLQRAKAQTNVSKRTFERTKALMAKNLASQADYDNAITTYESNVAAQKQAQSELDRANINLKYATVRSPIEGVVISRNVDVGQTVAASFAAPVLFTIANDLTKMQVQADVDEADIGRVQVGQDVSFTVDAYPEQTFHGSVAQIRLAPVTVQNVVNYTVIIDVPNPDMKLMPGMTATVSILISKKEGVLKVPTIALRFQPPQDLIEVRKDSAAGPEDSVRAERRRQFMQGAAGGQGGQNPWAGRAGFSPSRLWVLTKDKKLSPIFVRPGMSDGTFTEIVHGKVDDGQEVVVGILSQRPNGGNTPLGPGGRMRF